MFQYILALSKMRSRKTKTIYTAVVFAIFFMVIYYLWLITNLVHVKYINERDKVRDEDSEENFEYVVEDGVCKIPRINPYTAKLIEHLDLSMTCAAQPEHTPPLVTKHIYNNTDLYVLKVNQNANVNCCYRDIQSVGGDGFSLSPCITFQNNFMVPTKVNGMIVNCRRNGSKKIIFMDAFFFIQNQDYAKSVDNKIGVLIFGIDSLSQINFRRRMPYAYNYLRNHKNIWYQMLGYNKLGYDSMPNLMALLTGYNLAKKHNDCNPYEKGALDSCPFLWKQAQSHGRPTAFAEDRTDIQTLTTNKVGFTQTPTDYYLRPYIMAAQQQLRLSADFKVSKYCLGARPSANHVLGYALEFALQRRGHGGLGVFWLNSFRDQHEAATIMQHHLYKYLETLKRFNLLENYVVILLSGNGMLNGELNNLKSGFYEERLPILYISIPQAWKRAHPAYVDILKLNAKRLISPLDLHQTVKHVLALDADGGTTKQEIEPSVDCPACRSILRPIFTQRKCSDAGIDWLWCSCEPYNALNVDSKAVAELLKSLLAEMNQQLLVDGLLNGTCYTLSLHTIYGVYKSQHNTNYYYVKFKTTMREAEFELALWYANNMLPLYLDHRRLRRLDVAAVGCLRHVRDALLQKLCVCAESIESNL